MTPEIKRITIERELLATLESQLRELETRGGEADKPKKDGPPITAGIEIGPDGKPVVTFKADLIALIEMIIAAITGGKTDRERLLEALLKRGALEKELARLREARDKANDGLEEAIKQREIVRAEVAAGVRPPSALNIADTAVLQAKTLVNMTSEQIGAAQTQLDDANAVIDQLGPTLVTP